VLANVKHVFVKAAPRLKNLAGNSHRPARKRQCRLRGSRGLKCTRIFRSCSGPTRQPFALKRHLLCASLYSKQLVARFVTWREFAELPPKSVSAFLLVVTPQSSCRLTLGTLTTPW